MSGEQAESTVYALKHAVELKRADGSVAETLTELTFQRLKGGAARRALNAKDKGTGEFVAALVCASAQIPPSTFDMLDAEDVFGAMEIATGFFGVSLPT